MSKFLNDPNSHFFYIHLIISMKNQIFSQMTFWVNSCGMIVWCATCWRAAPSATLPTSLCIWKHSMSNLPPAFNRHKTKTPFSRWMIYKWNLPEKIYAFTCIFWLFFTTNFFFKNAFAFPEPVKSSKWTQIFHCQISIIISAKFHCWLKRKFNLLKRFSARNNPNAFWCVTTRHYKILWQKKNNPIAAQARKRAFLSPKKWREPISRLKAIFWFFPYWMCSLGSDFGGPLLPYSHCKVRAWKCHWMEGMLLGLSIVFYTFVF